MNWDEHLHCHYSEKSSKPWLWKHFSKHRAGSKCYVLLCSLYLLFLFSLVQNFRSLYNMKTEVNCISNLQISPNSTLLKFWHAVLCLFFGGIFKMSWWHCCWIKLKSPKIVHYNYSLVLKLWQEDAGAMK